MFMGELKISLASTSLCQLHEICLMIINSVI